MTDEVRQAKITVLLSEIEHIRANRKSIDKSWGKTIAHAKARSAHWAEKAKEAEDKAQRGGIRDDERIAKLEDQIKELRAEP